MKKFARLPIAVAAITALSACGGGSDSTSPAPSSAAGTTTSASASPSPSAPDDSFSTFLKGTWTCEATTSGGSEFPLPDLNVYLQRDDPVKFTISEGKWSASWEAYGDQVTFDGTWTQKGREISIQSPVGNQIIGNAPETVDYAKEQVPLEITGQDSLYIQATGQRTLALINGQSVSTCFKH